MLRFLILPGLLLALLLGGCGGEASSDGASVLAKTEGCEGPDGGLVLLCNLMGGDFQLVGPGASAAKARFMVIWPETKEGYWVYEEMDLGRGDAPRQRVHRLTGKEGHYRTRLYEIPEASRFVGAAMEQFDILTPEQLTPIEGCEIPLERVEEFLFAGEVPAGSCLSGLPHGNGATLHMKVTPKGLIYTEFREDSDPVEIVFQKSGA